MTEKEQEFLTALTDPTRPIHLDDSLFDVNYMEILIQKDKSSKEELSNKARQGQL